MSLVLDETPTDADLEDLEHEDISEAVLNVDDCDLPSSLSMYYMEISKYKILTKEEEVELSTRYLNGDKEAGDLLLSHNLRLVVSIAKRLKTATESLEDTIENGNLGLMRALKTFDPKRGYKFSTYATWWIRQYIKREQYDTASMIRVPVHMIENMNKYRRWEDQYVKEYGCSPSDWEVDEFLDSIKVSRFMLSNYKAIVTTGSLNQPIKKEDSESEMGEFIPDEGISVEDMMLSNELSELLYAEIDRLCKNERDRIIMYKRFGILDDIPKTLEEIGEEFNITRERVRQIEAKVLRKLRNSRTLRNYRRVV